MGKWKVEKHMQQLILDNVFVEITSNSFSILGIAPCCWPFDTTTFIYSWEKVNYPPAFTATVMRNVNDTRYGFDFVDIYDGSLYLDVFKDPSPNTCFDYTLVRVKE